MTHINYQNARFLLSAQQIAQLPLDEGKEVAFVGRSNAGKSSALNALAQQKKLARTSKTPGRTQLINIFTLTDTQRLVDLPGYGYAKAPISAQQVWGQLINEYLLSRQSLQGLVLLMDIRHPLKPQDQNMIQWSLESGIGIHLVLTKADKLSKSQATKTLMSVKKTFKDTENAKRVSMQCFSALKKTGLDELQALLNVWLSNA